MSNPYNYHLPIQDDTMFYGRSGLLRDLIRGLAQSRPLSAAVFGGRRCGKTSLLRKLERDMRGGPAQAQAPVPGGTAQAPVPGGTAQAPVPGGTAQAPVPGGVSAAGNRMLIPWYYDPQAGYPISSADDFFRLVLEMLRRALYPRPAPPGASDRQHPAGRSQVQASALASAYESAHILGPANAFAEGFRLLTAGLERRIRLVLLVDEAEALLTAPWGGDLRPNLRNLLSNSEIADDLALVMAGSTAFYTQVTEQDSPLTNILTRYSLHNLTREETLALAGEPNEGRLPAAAAEEVWVQSGGHPCLAQFILQQLWDDPSGLPPGTGLVSRSPQDVQDVAASFSVRVDHFERWSAALSPLAHDVYRWLAAQRAPMRYVEARRAFATADGGDLLRALDALAYHGLVNATSHGMRYEVAGHMFRDWYLSDRPAPGEPGQDEGRGTAHGRPGPAPKYQVRIGRADHVAVGDGAQSLHEIRRTQARKGRAAAEPVLPALPPQPAYDTFDLEIETRGSGRYEIQVLDAPTGPVRSQEVAFDPAELQFQAMLKRAQVGDVDAALLSEIGQQLYAFLFPVPVLTAYVASREAARARDRGLCVKLRLYQAELATLPWELLCDPQEGSFMALSNRTPLVRFLPGVMESPLPPAPLPWRLLLVTASPEDLPALDIERERAIILDAVRPLVEGGQVAVEILDRATPAALLAALRKGVHWLHFIGHGEYDERTGRGALMLEGPDHMASSVDVHTLRHLLPEAYEQAGARLRLAFLNACATAQVGMAPGTRGLAQTLVQAGIPTTIGMGRPIADRSARAFSEGFYGALAQGGWPFYAAVTEGRRRMMIESGIHSGDWAVPLLFMRTLT